VQTLYAGHEIAGHSYSHPGLAQVEEIELFRQIELDMQILSPLKRERLVSFAYPLGSYNKTVMEALTIVGFSNARTVEDTNAFRIPENFMSWHPTIHHSKALPVAAKYIALQPENLTVMMVWGHSWELEQNKANNNWQYIESLFKSISKKKDIWYVSAGEFVDFIHKHEIK